MLSKYEQNIMRRVSAIEAFSLPIIDFNCEQWDYRRYNVDNLLKHIYYDVWGNKWPV